MRRSIRVPALLAALALVVLLSAACSQKKSDEAGAPSGGDGTISPMFPQQTRMLESALREDPNNAGLLIQLGNLYYDWGQSEIDAKGQMAQPAEKWDKAIMYYKRALDIDPKNVNVRVDMANLVKFMGDIDGAIAEYRKAIQTDPKHAQARINLILALGQEKRDYKDAEAEYQALIKAVPEQKNNEELKAAVEGFRNPGKAAAK